MSEADEIAELYWESDIPVSEIAHAYGLNSAHAVLHIAGPATFDDLKCKHCGEPIEVMSRADHDMRLGMARYGGGDEIASSYPRHCRPCGADRLKARKAAQMREIEEKMLVRRERQEILRTMPYQEYLQTTEWQTTRNAALKRARYRCQTCAGQGRLNVHHRTYVRRGAELNSDLIVLCADCHQLFHEKQKLADKGKADA